MTEKTEPRNPKQPKPAPKQDAELTEGDLDKVSGGRAPTSPATPPGVPIPYPNIG